MDLPSRQELLAAASKHRPLLEKFLKDLIRVPSVHGQESGVQLLVREYFEDLGRHVTEVPMDEELREDPEYTLADTEVPYEGRNNLVIDLGGNGGGRSLILNTHSDVVPAGSWEGGFDPTVRDGVLTGRGSVDCKGQIGAVFLMCKLLEEFNLKPRGKLSAQVVIEEEIGGNGTLSLIRKGYSADGVVVLEGTDLTVCPANRGAVWFRATVDGIPVHMARKYEGVSAIEKSMDLIKILHHYELELAEEAGEQPLFSEYEHPVQVNVGRMEAGDWPATVPGFSVLEGGVGFLPNRTLGSIKEDLVSLLKRDEWLSEHGNFEFARLHNDAYQIPVDHPLVMEMVRSAGNMGIDARVRGMIASCDARLFNRVGGMPTVVFGAGDIDQAHSRGERVDLGDIALEAGALLNMACAWCGA